MAGTTISFFILFPIFVVITRNPGLWFPARAVYSTGVLAYCGHTVNFEKFICHAQNVLVEGALGYRKLRSRMLKTAAQTATQTLSSQYASYCGPIWVPQCLFSCSCRQ